MESKGDGGEPESNLKQSRSKKKYETDVGGDEDDAGEPASDKTTLKKTDDQDHREKLREGDSENKDNNKNENENNKGTQRTPKKIETFESIENNSVSAIDDDIKPQSQQKVDKDQNSEPQEQRLTKQEKTEEREIDEKTEESTKMTKGVKIDNHKAKVDTPSADKPTSETTKHNKEKSEVEKESSKAMSDEDDESEESSKYKTSIQKEADRSVSKNEQVDGRAGGNIKNNNNQTTEVGYSTNSIIMNSFEFH